MVNIKTNNMKKTETGLSIVNREELQTIFAENSLKRKGILILGLPGRGKTWCIRQQRMVSASKLAMEFQAYGLDAIKSLINAQISYQAARVSIDDLGIEQSVKHFGNGLDPIAWVIQSIYDINQVAEQPIQLLMTSNLNVNELTEKYGERIMSRIEEMCDIVVLEDTNLRKQKQND